MFVKYSALKLCHASVQNDHNHNMTSTWPFIYCKGPYIFMRRNMFTASVRIVASGAAEAMKIVLDLINARQCRFLCSYYVIRSWSDTGFLFDSKWYNIIESKVINSARYFCNKVIECRCTLNYIARVVQQYLKILQLSTHTTKLKPSLCCKRVSSRVVGELEIQLLLGNN